MQERRQFARIPVSLMLKFKSISQFENLVEASIGDLSLGGMFISTKHIKPAGTLVQMELPVKDQVLCIKGTVRSVRYKNDEPVGMGIEFQDLDDLSKRLIQFLVEKHNAKRQAAGG